MACTSGCRTKDHASYSECLRDKGVRTYMAEASKGLDGSAEKRKDSELAAYKAARAQGIQPDGTTRHAVEHAVSESNKHGMAYGRDFNVAAPMEG